MTKLLEDLSRRTFVKMAVGTAIAAPFVNLGSYPAYAATGGVMGVTSVRNFVTNEEPTTIEDYIDHIDHVVKLVGIDHVGVGTDNDLNGYDDLPEDFYKELKSGYKGSYAFRDKLDIEGLDHPKKMFDLTEALICRGYGDDNIRAILGGNFQRVLGEIWSPSPVAAEVS